MSPGFIICLGKCILHKCKQKLEILHWSWGHRNKKVIIIIQVSHVHIPAAVNIILIPTLVSYSHD